MNNKQKTRPQRRNSSGLVIRMSLQLMIILYVPSHICNREKKLVFFFCFFLAMTWQLQKMWCYLTFIGWSFEKVKHYEWTKPSRYPASSTLLSNITFAHLFARKLKRKKVKTWRKHDKVVTELPNEPWYLWIFMNIAPKTHKMVKLMLNDEIKIFGTRFRKTALSKEKESR